jgi:hypothetical protein
MTYHVAAQLKMYTIFQLLQQRKPYNNDGFSE